jgi:hypothetical protein
MWAIANISIAHFFELLEGQRVGIPILPSESRDQW